MASSISLSVNEAEQFAVVVSLVTSELAQRESNSRERDYFIVSIYR